MECSNQCGAGISMRVRECSNPPPRHGGAECVADRVETMPCLQLSCADGKYRYIKIKKTHYVHI